METSKPQTGIAETLAPDIRRILAPNPSPMTYWGTNTYLIGTADIAVIDPGPDSDVHLGAILSALQPGQKISHILVTHSHADHSPLAARLSQQSGAQVHAFGASGAGRSAVMQKLAAAGLSDAGEGVQRDFAPDVMLADGENIDGDTWSLTALWTPGHLGNHLCFQMGDTVFCGDLVMGWASSLVSPPDGDLTDFMASCHRLKTLQPKTMHAGHGAPIDQPGDRLAWLIHHRMSRESAILETLKDGPNTAASLAHSIYIDTPKALLPAATRNVLAHLIDLFCKSQVRPIDTLSEAARFELC